MVLMTQRRSTAGGAAECRIATLDGPMGTLDRQLIVDLRDGLRLGRAVETGTFLGVTARALAGVFPEVITIELSPELHERAAVALTDLPHVTALQGHSGQVLTDVSSEAPATLYFLDGHWSGGPTEGADDQCPVLAELNAIGAGNPNDCIVIDDARLFTSTPPPPNDPDQWPTLLDVIDAIRAGHPQHHVTLLADQVIAVPPAGRDSVDAYGLRVQPRLGFGDRMFALRNRVRHVGLVVRKRLRR